MVLGSAPRRFALQLLVCLAVLGGAAFLDAVAEAQCSQNGTTVTCTGALGSVTFTAPGAQLLTVGSLTGNATLVSLTGTGSASGSGGDSHFTCSPNPADCDITFGVNAPDTCTVKSGAPSGTACVATGPAALGPTGTSGPNVTVVVNTGAFLIVTGAAPATVVGRSQGSNGGNGGNAYVVGNAGSGGSGANGGNVTVVLTGNASPASGRAGAVAASLAGDGGNGGNAYVIGGSAGSGGLAGFGGDANVSHLSGAVTTTGAAGIGAFSQGGNGGSAGGGGGLVFVGGDGGSAGQAGAAQAATGQGSNITTFGSHAYGVLAQSLGGGGGTGSGGFGLFYSGGGGGSTGGAGGLVNVDAAGTIVTHGAHSHGILAQSIGGGGGDAGTTAGLVALGGSGAGGGAGRQVSVTNTGSITTFGSQANAIEAQSIGGGGGNGSSTGGLVSLGGNGAGTTTGGSVTVSNAGVLQTSGLLAAGILAQSIGGGGGNGGTSGGVFSWGGNGGSGAHGGAVTVFNSGNISAGLNGAASIAAHGIVAQSIGGGGGNGGGSIAIDVTNTGLSAAFGGSGGVGGNGGHAQLRLDNVLPAQATAYTIETFGAHSNAVTVQSIGGGGGSGGFAVSVSTSVAFGVAGAGGPGGNGGLVDVWTKGALITHADNSIGLLAQSIGGGGGNGGFALSAGGGAAVSVGGGGGIGGTATTVNVSSFSDITTSGANSHGILAQSIGGGGGNGGFAGAASLAVSVGVGGSGGSGGASGQVFLTSIGDVATAGDNAMGVAAQSLGGGGGNGGFAVALGVSVATVSVGVGGSGGSGGSSSSVTLLQSGLVSTSGHSAPGVLGQSIGGGGGNGGFSFTLAGGAAVGVAVGVGGSGGGGSTAGNVNVVTAGAGVTTVGDHSPGIRAQSIGGGGGNGGFSVGIAASATFMGVGGAAAVTVGGGGGLAGNAGTVLVNSTGVISTQGTFSHGIEAQSIGGGGGSGGFSVAGAFTLGQVAAGVAVGGGGDGGGSAQTVTVIAAGVAGTPGFLNSPAFGTTTLETTGVQAHGILAQSLGGGGGNGGFAGALGAAIGGAGGGVSVGGGGAGGGIANVVNVTSFHNILTQGERSVGILAQSIGGGGGNGGFSIGLGGGSQFGGAVSVGGSGSGGSSADNVFVKSYGTIATQGIEAHGIQAQSIGGGGGNGGASIAGTFSTGPVAIGVAVGGTGAGGGLSDSVDVQAYASAAGGIGILTPPTGIVTLSTSGYNAHGIFAQSIGGGGGNGGFAGALGVATGGFGVGFSVGGDGGGGSDGAAVVVTSVHNILTEGHQSSGIMAQSIGGGGGNGGFSIGLGGGSQFGAGASVGGFGNTGGNASTVSATNIGSIQTSGDDSHGIAAQSIGGGGGNGGFSLGGAFSAGPLGLGISVGGFGAVGGTGAGVVVTSYALDPFGLIKPLVGSATLITDGDRANGILAQSIGGGGGNGGFSGAAGIASGDVGIGLSVGGMGEAGGVAGSVQVNSVHNIVTDGQWSHGILAQSLGGGGGNGGFSLGIGAGAKVGGAVSVGGFALGGGGDAEFVTVKSWGTIVTHGFESHGIFAQSVGGSGGSGGAALSGGASLDNGALAVSVGGAGSNGGLGRNVTVERNLGTTQGLLPTISALGSGSGIVAQSIGGGGGSGGFAGSLTAVLAGSFSVSVSVGGFGGAGSSAGTVTVTTIDNILTVADDAMGILAQSIGGGGGNGGMAIGATTVLMPDDTEVNISGAWGGTGGSGANSGVVTVNSTGNIWTQGVRADGILAQSLGGGGGNGRLAVAAAIKPAPSQTSIPSATAAVGGFGGSGGAGAAVSLTHLGSIVTLGDESAGLRAQSIGGGGGNGGVAIAGSISGGDSKQFVGSLGGFGGAGSSAADVLVDNTGSITTGTVSVVLVQLPILGQVFGEFVHRTGTGAHGIVAQSIGGGGGSGGLAISGAIGLIGATSNVNIGVSVGGFGGSGGTAGQARVLNNGVITTFGHAAHGILAQSIGGGGGAGGGSITGLLGAGDPTASTARAVNVNLTVGGFGGDGNLGGAVEVVQSGGISTFGNGSHGIFAQSIGGGGGSAGDANSLSLFLGTKCTFDPIGFLGKHIKSCQQPGKGGAKVQIVVGGFGGSGNHGGTVTVTNHGFITATGFATAGIKAQSIGGGGGSGGNAMTSSDGLAPGVFDDGLGLLLTVVGTAVGRGDTVRSIGAFTFGGNGGASGDGAKVTVTNHGTISIAGDLGYGIFAQSVGGGGGDGGAASAGMTGLFGWGGTGGASGSGGEVVVTNTGLITTGGVFTGGVVAQSIGGGGGDGGNVGGIIAIGGTGGASGDGGKVTVTNQGGIHTFGLFSVGVRAQSIGGGGGGHSSSGGDTGTFGTSLISIGGAGGATGNGGEVIINNFGSVTTQGFASDALRAQSLGGGGGSSGDNSGSQINGLVFGLGGAGGAAGDGGTVRVTNTSLLSTVGDQADGIFAQSVGGGGGDGGRTVGLIAVGGASGSSGDGGLVQIENQATGIIWTRGMLANGIYAQSIGGGGGNAGSTFGIALLPISTAVGRSGAGGGAGGQVTIDNHGWIQTDGAQSQGIFAQSIGGGGGDGSLVGSIGLVPGIASVGGSGGGGAGGLVTVTNHATGTVITNGANSTAIFAQSIGGGGGTASLAFTANTLVPVPLLLGGTGGTGGAGGGVSVLNEGTIVINGDGSVGIIAQSVGGGGGTTRLSFEVFGFPVQLGGTPGVVGNGGDVTVTNAGSIVVNGDNSIGIFAQSVGGGGGIVMPGSGAAGVIASDGGAGNGGLVTVSNTGNSIFVTGANSVAMIVQSVGGGGGFVGTSLTPSQVSAANGNGAAAAGGAPGVGGVLFLGSAGGAGTSAATTLNQTGHLIATGLNSSALVVQSHGPSGSGDITINILNASPDQQSMIIGGTGTGAGVVIMNGALNVLNNGGFIASMLGLDGFAVRAGTGDDRVVNTGTIIGSIDLGAGANSMWNQAGATFDVGSVLALGAGVLTNDGDLAIGGTHRITTTNLTGSFAQSESGTLYVDLDLQLLRMDRLNVTGTSALAGTVNLNLIDPIQAAMHAKPGEHDLALIVAAGAVPSSTPIDSLAQSTFTLTAPNTAVANYSLNQLTTGSFTLRSVIDFSPDGMTANAAAIGEAINAIQTEQRSPNFWPIAASLFYQPDVPTLNTIYESMGGAAAAGTQQSALLAVDRFLTMLEQQTLFWLGNQASAPNGFTAAGDRALESVGRSRAAARRSSGLSTPGAWRMWVTAFDGHSDLPGNAAIGSVPATSEGRGLVGGVDFQVSPRVFVGAAGGHGSFDFDAPGAETSGQASGIHAAAYGAYRRASYYISGAVALGFFSNDVSRRIFIPGTSVPLPDGAVFSEGVETPFGEFRSRAITGAVEAGYRITFGAVEFTPYGGLQATALNEDGYTETTLGEPSVLGSTRLKQTTTSFPAFVGMQWKVEGDLGTNKVLSVYFRAAWRHEFKPQRYVNAEFNAAPEFSFVIRGAEPLTDSIRATLGFRQQLGRGLSLFAQIDGEFTEWRRTYGGSLGLRAGW